MSLLDGKQLRDGSISLDKLKGNTGLVTFTASATMSFEDGAILRRDTADILIGIDVVNKEYVDSVAAGLNPKESARLIYNGSVTSETGYTYSNGSSGVGATLTFTSLTSVDGVSFTNGDRVIFNSTSDKFVNGIYVYGTTASFFTRSSDFDGSPTQEVNGGEFSFVTEGTAYADTGWVVSSPNSTATIGVTPISWVQFSAAGVITAGEGLYQSGNSFNVGAGTGITVSTDAIAIANTTVVANTYGGSNQTTTFTVNAQGQLTNASTQSISITSNQITDFTSATETVVFTDANFVDGSTVQFDVTAGASTTAEVINGSLTASKLDTNSQGATAGYILSVNSDGSFAWIQNDAGDITGVTAGAGLSGGGSSGYITLDVNLGVDGGLTFSGDNIVVDYTSVASGLDGAGLVVSGSELAVNTGVGLTISGDAVSIDPIIAGIGLSFSSGVINVETTINKGLTFSTTGPSGTLEAMLKPGGGLTFSQGAITTVLDGVTLDVVDGALTVIGGAAQPVYQMHLTPSATVLNANFQTTGLTLSNTPNDYSRVSVYVNGQFQYLGNGVGSTASGVDCYFSADGGVTPKNITDLVAGDTLYWNGNTSNAGFKLDITDRVDIIYES